MHLLTRNRLSVLIAALLPITSVQATETIALEDMKITAIRADSEAWLTRHVDLVEQDALDRLQAQSVPETVSKLANVSLRGGPREDVQNVNIRGLGDNRVLQLVDGVRQNFFSGHRPTYFLDPALLQNVEVIKGPVSSLWGSGALGGVVSSNTIHAADLLDAGESFGGFIKQGFNSNNDKWLTTAALAGRYGDVDLLVSGFYRDGDDLEIGGGDTLTDSAVRDRGMLAKMDWFIDSAQTATFNFRTSNTDGSVPSNGSAVPTTTSNFLIERRNITNHASVDYQFNPDSDWINSNLKLYWNETRMDERRVSDGRSDNTEIRTLGMNLNNLSQLGKVQLLYGIDGYQDKFTSDRGGMNRPAPPEATTDVWGVFANVQVPFNTQWLLELGARYDYFATEADNLDADRSDNAFSPSAAVSWLPTEDLRLTFRYDEAFRAPTAEELYTTGSHFCIFPGFCNSFVPDPSLKPEEAQNIELLLDYQMRSIFNDNDTLTWHAAAFHNDVDNFIEQIVTDPVFNVMPNPPGPPSVIPVNAGTTFNRNVDEAKLVGFELAMRYQWQSWQAFVSYGQTRAQNEQTGEALTNIPADKWVLDLNKSWRADSLLTGLTVSRVESQTHLPNSFQSAEYDHYTLLDMYASWTPQQFDNLTVDLTLNNLTDQKYTVAFEQLAMPGRDVRLSVKYDF
ncbi:TonB-dependent hemin, ferrichrome receptor [Methylophaga frappieri]|uniref:TonB-dependent hemin, ferrichrome receptor n=1 Tax=Methylophaga frappieri (strain ATCC BAA-2434 / DSM 25690 / JAM7) TaxID=754477 RepID=I1YIZ9_METFJ|nr:TonB-dependent hemoglobin/transferrin/lactoferrin family receptor [Methylophaga frappieri]AFJ02892.1 TonB-dependent hemin, ferrichrome receptor [Methylophaga frappieri]